MCLNRIVLVGLATFVAKPFGVVLTLVIASSIDELQKVSNDSFLFIILSG